MMYYLKMQILSVKVLIKENHLINFLKTLNDEVNNTGQVWLTDAREQNNTYFLRGLSLNSNTISQLSYNLGNVNLNTVRHRRIGSRKVFEFECEKLVDMEEKEPIFGELKMPDGFGAVILRPGLHY